MEIQIRALKESDYPAVREIYQQGINTRQATFETQTPNWDDWNERFLKKNRLVALSLGQVVGWAATSGVSSRCVYAGVCEGTVYIREGFRGKGIGSLLLKSLVEHTEKTGFWTLEVRMFPENTGSVELHKQMGFVEVGRREKLGKLDGQWKDVLLMERRSNLVGN